MAIEDEIKIEQSKLKNMDRQHKLNYIWTYYKFWIIGGLLVILAVLSIAKSIIANSKPIYLEAIFINSELGVTYDSDLFSADFAKAAEINEKKYRMMFDYSSNISNDYSDQTAYANQIKLISRYSAEEVDVCAGPESIMTGVADVGGYANLEEVLPEALIQKINEKGYEFFYYTGKKYGDDIDKNSEEEYSEGEPYIGGIYLDKSSKIFDEFNIYSRENNGAESGDRIVLTIASNTPELEHAIEFVEYVIED